MSPTEIREMRKRLGISQEKLASVIGVTFTTISRWENGVGKPSPLAIHRLNEVLKSQNKAREGET